MNERMHEFGVCFTRLGFLVYSEQNDFDMEEI